MNMIVKISLFSLLLGSTCGFHVIPTTPTRQSRHFSTVEQSDALPGDKAYITSGAKERLLDIAYDLKDDFGVFVIDKNGLEKLRSAVDDLEAVSDRPSFDDETKETFKGNWTLVCTTTSNSALPNAIQSGIDTSRIPFFNEGPLKDIRNNLNKCLHVQQVIMARDCEDINRVDHVLEYQPPKNLQDIIDNLPSLNINPLDVTKGKVVLVHDASIKNPGPGFSTELKLDSIVVNVAGTSRYLESDGKDILGINMPLKEFQAGTFETTYLDKDLRISRGTVGSTEQLRVYVKPETSEDDKSGVTSRAESTDSSVEDPEPDEDVDDDFGNPDPDPGFEL